MRLTDDQFQKICEIVREYEPGFEIEIKFVEDLLTSTLVIEEDESTKTEFVIDLYGKLV